MPERSRRSPVPSAWVVYAAAYAKEWIAQGDNLWFPYAVPVVCVVWSFAGSLAWCAMGLSRCAGCRGVVWVCGYVKGEGARVVSPPFQGLGAAACYSPTPFRVQYHRRARS